MKHNLKLATTLTMCSAFIYALVAVFVKQYAYDISTFLMVFIQLATCLVLILLMLVKNGKMRLQAILQSPNKKTQLLRAIFSLGNGCLFYYSLKFLPLVNGVLLVNIAPLLVPLLGALFFHKKLYYQIIIAIAVGFVGVALVLNPHAQDFKVASFFAIGASICMALAALLIRKATEKGDDGFTTSFYLFFFGTILSGLISIPFWHAAPISVYLIIIFSGALLFIVQYTYSFAFQHAEANFVSSIFYSNIIFATIFNIFIFKHYPALATYLGMLLIIMGGILTIQIQGWINKYAS